MYIVGRDSDRGLLLSTLRDGEWHTALILSDLPEPPPNWWDIKADADNNPVVLVGRVDRGELLGANPEEAVRTGREITVVISVVSHVGRNQEPKATPLRQASNIAGTSSPEAPCSGLHQKCDSY